MRFIDIHPPLNDAEQGYLTAYAGSRRTDTGQPPYVVPDNPAAEDFEPMEHLVAATPGRYSAADLAPGPWCGWVPAWDGACMTFDGKEKFGACSAAGTRSPGRLRRCRTRSLLIVNRHVGSGGRSRNSG
jgi:hypothetical protein